MEKKKGEEAASVFFWLVDLEGEEDAALLGLVDFEGEEATSAFSWLVHFKRKQTLPKKRQKSATGKLGPRTRQMGDQAWPRAVSCQKKRKASGGGRKKLRASPTTRNQSNPFRFMKPCFNTLTVSRGL